MISVLERLSIIDRIRFASSCSSFYSIFRAAQRLCTSKSPPWMLLPGQSTPTAIAFFNISDGRIYRIPQKETEEEESSIRGRRRRLLFLGSSDGWLVILDQGYSHFYLLNPITRAKIDLPPLPSSKLVPLESSKAILSFNSSSSSPPSYTVVLLLARYSISSAGPTGLVCCTSKQAWTPFGRRALYSDAAITSTNLYTMQANGTVEVWDLSSGGPSLSTTIVMPKSLSTRFASFTKYVVKDGGRGRGRGRGLLQVWRSRKFAKVEFKVFKLEARGKEEEWVEVKSLDGRIVFLNSCCSSMSMMSEECPPELAGASNSIYFDCLTTAASCIDLGSVNSSKNRETMVFRMEDDSVESVLIHGSIWEPPPIWIVPTLLCIDCSGGQ